MNMGRSGLIILLTTLSVGLMASGDGWSLQKDKNGVKVYTKPSDRGTKLKDSKAEMLIDGTPEEVLSVLFDIENYVNWIPKCKESVIVEQPNSMELVYHATYSAPVVSNRDLVVRMIASKNEKNGVITVEMNGESEVIEKVKGIVRIPYFKGKYILTPRGDQVKVVNLYSTDPGGSIPAWLANSTAVDTPYETFINLKKQLSK